MTPSGKLPVQAVVFDLDDTLYAERDYVRSGYRAAGQRLRHLLKTAQRYEDDLWQLFQAGQGSKVFNTLSDTLSLGLTEPQISELVETYRNHVPTLTPYSGIPDLLGRLHEHYHLGLLSDGLLPAQRLKLEALKLQRFFDQVLFSAELGRDCWKPSPAGFVAIAERLGVPHEACAYIADNPAKDFVAPNALGWRTIQYLRPGQIHSSKPAPPDGPPGTIVRAADQLLAALRT